MVTTTSVTENTAMFGLTAIEGGRGARASDHDIPALCEQLMTGEVRGGQARAGGVEAEVMLHGHVGSASNAAKAISQVSDFGTDCAGPKTWRPKLVRENTTDSSTCAANEKL